MNTKLYVCTGTGNSLWIARQLAMGLKEVSLESMRTSPKDLTAEADETLLPNIFFSISAVVDCNSANFCIIMFFYAFSVILSPL
ncbi:MAG: hypothetical protein ACXWMI_07805 [Syntrophales bacterium]